MPHNRGRDSADMLRAAAARVNEAGYHIVNLDCVVHAEQPKLADYHDAIRHRIAGILNLNPHQIGIKAKTGEGVGPVGQPRNHRSPLHRANRTPVAQAFSLTKTNQIKPKHTARSSPLRISMPGENI